MSERNPDRHDDESTATAVDTITIAIEIDPSEFDEPRQLMYERLVEEYGRSRIEELIRVNVEENVADQAMQIVNALWDNRDQIDVEPDGVETPQVPDQREGEDD